MELLFVPYDFDSTVAIALMVEYTKRLPKWPMPQILLYFVAVGNMVARYANIVPAFIVKAVIQLVILVSYYLLTVPAQPVNEPVLTDFYPLEIIHTFSIFCQNLFDR
jgi:hypothetical protein